MLRGQNLFLVNLLVDRVLLSHYEINNKLNCTPTSDSISSAVRKGDILLFGRVARASRLGGTILVSFVQASGLRLCPPRLSAFAPVFVSAAFASEPAPAWTGTGHRITPDPSAHAAVASRRARSSACTARDKAPAWPPPGSSPHDASRSGGGVRQGRKRQTGPATDARVSFCGSSLVACSGDELHGISNEAHPRCRLRRSDERVSASGNRLSPHLNAAVRTPFGHQLDVGFVVFVAEERLLPAVSAPRNMMGDCASDNSGDSRQIYTSNHRAECVKKYARRPPAARPRENPQSETCNPQSPIPNGFTPPRAVAPVRA